MQGHPFRHEMLGYVGGAAGFVDRALPLISCALSDGAPVLVAVTDDRAALLRGALADRAEQVQFRDINVLGRNPGRIIPAWREFLSECAADGGEPLGVGEPVWPGRSEAELSECYRHEALLNLAFDAGRSWRLLCPYDLDGLDNHLIEAAYRSHPLVSDESATSSNAEVDATRTPQDSFDGALAHPAGEVTEMRFTAAELSALRQLLSAWALSQRLGSQPVEDLVLAVNELATNSVRYGGGHGTMLLWREQDTLLCEIRDRGYIEDPLIGRTRPAPEDPSGRGIWLVHQLCDLVQISSSPGATAVRVHKRVH